MFAPRTIIEGLRGVGRVELELREGQSAYVLLGTNGVGKTKTLEALFQAAFVSYLAASEDYPKSSLPADFFVFKTIGGRRAPELRTPKGQSYLELRDMVRQVQGGSALSPVFIGSQGRGFLDSSSGQPAKVGTRAQRKERYVASLLEGMQRHFTSLNMNSGIEQWFVARAQSANRYQSSDDNREVEIESVLDLMHRIDERVDPAFLEVSGESRTIVAAVGLALAGLGLANIVPIAFAAAGNVPGVPRGVSMSVVTGFGYAGILLAPSLIGFAAEAVALPVIFIALGALPLVAAWVAPKGLRTTLSTPRA